MGTPGTIVVRPSGLWGVLPSGLVAVRNGAGECPVCCGGGGPCCKFNLNTCSASGVVGDGFGNQVTYTRSGNFFSEQTGPFTGPNGSYSVAGSFAFPHNAYEDVTGDACGARVVPMMVSPLIPPIGSNAVGFMVDVRVGGVWRFKAPGTFEPSSPSQWIPYGSWSRLSGDPFFVYTFYSPGGGATIRVAWNLRTNAFGQEFGFGAPAAYSNADFAAKGYGHVNAFEAAGTPSVVWNGCVPTFSYQGRFLIDYNRPIATSLGERRTETNQINSFTHTVAGLSSC